MFETSSPGFSVLLMAWTSVLTAPLPAATVAKLADHPTSRHTAYPALHSARAFQNRVYFGYGDWNDYVATALVSYDPATNEFAIEHSMASDSVEMMREIDGTIYIPHCDPIHHEDFHDYSYRGPDGRWLQSAAMEQLHVFDFVKSPEGLFCGANGLYRSLDEGRTWTLVGSNFSDRLLWVFEFGGTVYSGSGRYQNGTFTARGMNATWHHATPIRDSGAGIDLVLGLTGGNNPPGILKPATGLDLVAFDGTQTRLLNWSIKSFTVENGTLFVLRGPGIYRCDNPAAAEPTFTRLEIDDIPSTARCLEKVGNRFYLGTSNGEIWVASADGSEVTVTPPTVVHRASTQFGRGLAFAGERLLVGAPDAPAAPSGTALAGRAEVWHHTGGAWRPEQEWTPPAPDFSGWFGRDVALHGDLMAVVEAGHDLSGRDRGSSAKVHVQQLTGGVWTPRATFTVPFAQTVALQEDMMVVGTSNQAANQASGRPGVIPYAITRDAAAVATFSPQPQLAPVSSAYGYKALVRVALLDDLLITGFTSDPSRGASGLVSVYRRDGVGFASQPVQELPVTAPQRFGFSLAAHDGWVAVGAPFEDTGATNAGAVFLYEKPAAAPPNAPLVLRQTLAAPTAQAHGEFGAAVAMHGDLLLVGSPGREINGVRQRGAVYRFRRQASGTWIPLGELSPPSASETEFGIEVAASAEWQAAGSLGSTAGATGLASRVRLAPRGGYEAWLDTRLVGAGRGPLDDAEADGLPSLLEYVFHLDPTTTDLPPAAASLPEPSGVPQAATASPAAGHVLTFVRPKNDPRVTVIVESSGDLDSWIEETSEPVVVASGTTHEVVALTSSAASPSRWWRIKASYQEE